MSIPIDTSGALSTLHGKAHPRREKVLYVRHLTVAEMIEFDTHEDDNVDVEGCDRLSVADSIKGRARVSISRAGPVYEHAIHLIAEI